MAVVFCFGLFGLAGVAWVELGQSAGRDALEHLLGEDTQQLPADVERLEDGAVLVVALRDEVLLELGEELEVEQVVGRQRLLAHHGLHRLHVLADGVARVLPIHQNKQMPSVLFLDSSFPSRLFDSKFDTSFINCCVLFFFLKLFFFVF